MNDVWLAIVVILVFCMGYVFGWLVGGKCAYDEMYEELKRKRGELEL